MSSNRFETTDWADRHRRHLATRHTHQDALTNREFERLLMACEQLPEPDRFEARLICLMAGRLGLRAGEIAHTTIEWIDWDRKLIRIPEQENCACGYCRRQAKQEADHNKKLSFAQAMRSRWHPKTLAYARVIPFDVTLRVELCIERFANRYHEFPKPGPRLIGECVRRPTNLDFLVGFIHTVSGPLQQASIPTAESHQFPCRR